MIALTNVFRLGSLVIALTGLISDAGAKDEVGPSAPIPLKASSTGLYGPDDVYANIPAKDEFGRDQLEMFRTWNPDPLGNHETNLKALNPSLAMVIRNAQAATPELHFVVGSGVRDQNLQRKAVAWGWSKTRDSLHRSGDAVDLWPLDQAGRVVFDPSALNRIAAAMKEAAARLGVTIGWGGYFRGFKDRDRSHFEIVSDHPRMHGNLRRASRSRPAAS